MSLSRAKHFEQQQHACTNKKRRQIIWLLIWVTVFLCVLVVFHECEFVSLCWRQPREPKRQSGFGGCQSVPYVYTHISIRVDLFECLRVRPLLLPQNGCAQCGWRFFVVACVLFFVCVRCRHSHCRRRRFASCQFYSLPSARAHERKSFSTCGAMRAHARTDV